MSIEDKIVWGGIYRVKNYWNADRLDEQHYNYAIPCKDEDDNIYMIDTYHINLYFGKGPEGTNKAIEFYCNNKEGNRHLWKNSNDYYYRHRIKIQSEYSLDNFELICDLHDYRSIERNEKAEWFDDKDKVKVILFREQNFIWEYGYTMGAILIRKDAFPNKFKVLKEKMMECNEYFKKPNFPSDYYTDKLETAYQDFLDMSCGEIDLYEKNQHDYDMIFKRKEFYQELNELIEKFEKENKFHYDFKFHKVAKQVYEYVKYTSAEEELKWRLEDIAVEVGSGNEIRCFIYQDMTSRYFQYPCIFLLYKNDQYYTYAMTKENLDIVLKYIDSGDEKYFDSITDPYIDVSCEYLDDIITDFLTKLNIL